MKKQTVVRSYNFSDAHLILKGKEKISFMRRDKTAFAVHGIAESMMAAFENALTDFSENATDIEAKSSQTAVTLAKNVKAEELRTAIRNVMKRTELALGANSAKYRLFRIKALGRKPDSDLLITAKVLVQACKEYSQNGIETGITTAMLEAIMTLCGDFELLIHEQNDKIWERHSQQENRIAQGNSIYATLTTYTAIGFSIWETVNVAKYNDYVIYDRASKN